MVLENFLPSLLANAACSGYMEMASYLVLERGAPVNDDENAADSCCERLLQLGSTCGY